MRTWKIVLRYVVTLAVVTLAQSQLRAANTISISGSNNTIPNTSGLTPTGFLNTQFSPNKTGTSFIPFTISGQGSLDACTAMATDSSGKIVLAGTTQIYDTSSNTDVNRFAIARFLAGGILDSGLINEAGTAIKNTTWNGTNYIPFNIGIPESDPSNATCMAIQFDGKIVVGGYSRGASGHTCFAIARFNSNGTLDRDFGGTGRNKSGTNLIDFSISGGTDDQATCIGIDNASGNIYLGGWSTDAVGNKRFALACFNSDGVLNTTGFNKGGGERAGTTFLSTNIAGGTDDTANALTIASDILTSNTLKNATSQTLIFLGGYSTTVGGDKRFAYAVFNLDGTSSTAFNNASTGYLSYSIAGATVGNGDDQITCLQTRVTNSYTQQTNFEGKYNQLNVPLFINAYENAYTSADKYADVSKTRAESEAKDLASLSAQLANQAKVAAQLADAATAKDVARSADAAASSARLANTYANALKNQSSLEYASVFANAYADAFADVYLKANENKSSFLDSFVKQYLKIYKNKSDRKEAVADAISNALGIHSNNRYVSTQAYDLAKKINSGNITLSTTPSTILLQAGGFSKGENGNYRFAVAQFTNQQGAIFGQEGAKNGSAYVPFSISKKTIGNDRATGITTAGPNGDIILGGWTQDQNNNYHFACADFLASGSLNRNFGNLKQTIDGFNFSGTTYINSNILGATSGTFFDESTCAIPSPTGFYLGGTSGNNTGGNHSRFAVASQGFGF